MFLKGYGLTPHVGGCPSARPFQRDLAALSPSQRAHRAALLSTLRDRELAGDTAFTGWLDASGLTLAEAARIQPAYSPDRARERRSYRLASLVTIPVSGFFAVWNAMTNENGNNAFVGALGIAAGVASIGYGASSQLQTGRAVLAARADLADDWSR